MELFGGAAAAAFGAKEGDGARAEAAEEEDEEEEEEVFPPLSPLPPTRATRPSPTSTAKTATSSKLYPAELIALLTPAAKAGAPKRAATCLAGDSGAFSLPVEAEGTRGASWDLRVASSAAIEVFEGGEVEAEEGAGAGAGEEASSCCWRRRPRR